MCARDRTVAVALVLSPVFHACACVRALSGALVSLSTAAVSRLLNDDICECSLGDMISEKAIPFINIPCRRELGMISPLRRHFLLLIVNINISSVFLGCAADCGSARSTLRGEASLLTLA